MSERPLPEGNGFTLLEIMIALTVFSLVVLMLGQYQVFLVGRRVYQQRYMKGLHYATQKVEDLRHGTFATVADQTEDFTDGAIQFRRTTDETTDVSGKYKTVDVSVTWKNSDGSYISPAPVELKTVISK